MRVFLAPLLIAATVGAVLLAGAQEPVATAPIPAGTTLRQWMSEDEFQAAGLKKLSAEELSSLDRFLRGMRAQAEKAAVEKVIPPPSPRRSSNQPLIESAIVGPFEGLKGRSRWLLKNGQVWQQSNAGEHFSARAESPGVVLLRTDFGNKMIVNGIAKPFYVRQIVLP